MALQDINRGTSPNDGSGTNAREAGKRINENFAFLYNGTADFRAILGPVLGVSNLSGNAANVINGFAPFTFPFVNLGFIKYVEYDNGDIQNIYFFKLTRLGGSASFGVGGSVALQAENLFLTGQKLKSVEDFEAINTTITEDFGDIGTTTVIDYVNGLSPALAIQATSVGATILKAVVNGDQVSFLFKGTGGDYGAGQLQLVEGDLELINETSSTSVFIENINQIPNRSYNDLQNKPNTQKIGTSEDLDDGYLLINDNNHQSVFDLEFFDLEFFPSQDAVFIKLKIEALKNAINPETTIKQTSVIDFRGSNQYGTADNPLTGALSINNTNARLGYIQKIYHDDSTAPSFPASFKVQGTGEYLENASADGLVNTIFVEWSSATRQVYWITQEEL